MEIKGKTVNIFRAESAGSPLVVLNGFERDGEIYKKCKELGCPDFSLAEITGLDWNSDLSPWQAPPMGQNEAPFGGKADEYLDLLLHELLPGIIKALGAQPKEVILAGYSLAGLFALYAATKCEAFQAVASCSGSLWFPCFKEYILSCKAEALPKTIYFSLGDREARTRNEALRTVEDNTRKIARQLSERGIKTVFELNKGNHFQQAGLRTAKGIKWLLENLQ